MCIPLLKKQKITEFWFFIRRCPAQNLTVQGNLQTPVGEWSNSPLWTATFIYRKFRLSIRERQVLACLPFYFQTVFSFKSTFPKNTGSIFDDWFRLPETKMKSSLVAYMNFCLCYTLPFFMSFVNVFQMLFLIQHVWGKSHTQVFRHRNF